MNSECKKPPLAPKPKFLVLPKVHPSPVPKLDLLPSPTSASRGPKPPLAPKPNVPNHLPVAELHQHNDLSRFTNGKVSFSREEVDEENESSRLCLDSVGIEITEGVCLTENVEASDEHVASPKGPRRQGEGVSDEAANVDSQSDDAEETRSANPTEKVESLDGDDASSSRNCSEELSSDLDSKEVNQSFEEAMGEDLSLDELLNCDSPENSTASERLLSTEVANGDLSDVSDVLGEAESAPGRTELPSAEEDETENECSEDAAQQYTDDTDCQIVPLEEDYGLQLDEFTQEERTFEDSELRTDACDPCVGEDQSNVQLLEEAPDCGIADVNAVLTDAGLNECISGENPELLLESDSTPEVYIAIHEDCIDDKLSSIMEENEGLDDEEPMESSDIHALEGKEELNEELIKSSNSPGTEKPERLEKETESLPNEEPNDPVEEATALTCVPAAEEQNEPCEEATESLCIPTAQQEPTETLDTFEEQTENDEKVDFVESSSVSEEKDELEGEKEPTESCIPANEENVELDEEEKTAEICNEEICNEGEAVEDGVDISNSAVEPQPGNESEPLLEEEVEQTDKVDDLPCVYFVADGLGLVDGTDGEAESDDRGFTVDRRNTITRTRSLTGKVPETVPEETGPESDASPSPQEPDGTATEEPGGVQLDGELCENIRTIPVKPKHCLFYPRSYSVESRDLPVSVCRETEGLSMEDGRMKRKDDVISQPCVIALPGSLSKRIHVPLFGVSNPSSVVDIPPPFELASITKKPITKSSPSLLIENESPDKYLKLSSKKKSSFKRFLPIKLSLKKKIDSKMEMNASRMASEAGHHGSARVLDFDRRSLGNSPQLKSRSGKLRASDSAATFLFYKDGKKKGLPKTFSRTVSRVESFEDRSRHSYMSLPLTKPRSISFPNADTSDYENIPAMSSDYENIQIPHRRCGRTGTFTEFFEDPSRAFSSACENDGYVDMSSFAPFDSRQFVDQESESAYTEPFRACAVNSLNLEDVTSDEDPANSSGEEAGLEMTKGEFGRDKQNDARRRAYRIAKEMAASEKGYVEILQLLHVDFREMVARASGEDGMPVVDEENLSQILDEMPDLCQFHQEMLKALEERVAQWEEEDRKIADIILSKEPGLNLYRRFITKYERNMSLLDKCCQSSSRFATVVREFELIPKSNKLGLKHYLLKVVQRVPQYCLYLTDYLNNLSPDSTEYEDTQAALVIVGGVADCVNVSVRQGGNFQKLLHIQHSITGLHEIVQPGRVFIKEGTLMKVSRKVHRPRCCFLMNDALLYTTPHSGRYKLNETLSLAGMKVSKPSLEEFQHPLRIQSTQRSLTFSVSSSKERDEWFDAISKALEDYRKIWGVLSTRATTELIRTNHHFQVISERPETGLGTKPPTLIPDSRVVMCMICTCDFSLTWRRHHCNACGKVVCRTCSRNKYPLKYLKGRPSRVCDQCFKEFKTKELTTNNENSLPVFARPSGSSLSSVFYNIHTSNKKQKRISAALMEVAATAEGSSMNGYLQRCKSHKRHWKKLWFVIKDKVLYTYAANGDKIATESLPLLGFTIQTPDRGEGQTETGSVFQLYHKKTLFYSFKAEDTNSAQRWIAAMFEASIL